jgi:hypothetical protein
MTTRLDPFTHAYIEAALWSTNDESREDGGDPLDQNYDRSDIDAKTMAAIIRDCADFQKRFGSLIEDDESKAIEKWGRWELAGHEFWLTRNGHGAGFGDGNFPKHDDELYEAAKSYGSFELYVGDDGVIYASGEEPSRSEVNEAARRPRGGWWIHWSNRSENGPFNSRAEAKHYADYWHDQSRWKLTFKIDQVAGWDERMGPRPVVTQEPPSRSRLQPPRTNPFLRRPPRSR